MSSQSRHPIRAAGRHLSAALLAAALVGPAHAGDVDLPPPIDLRAGFRAFDPGWVEHRKAITARLDALDARVAGLERAGRPVACAHQVLLEARWAARQIVDWPRATRLLDRLEGLAAETVPDVPDRQDEEGAWGRCLSEWFFRLDLTYDAIEGLEARGLAPAIPPRFFDRLNDPDRLEAYLLGLSEADLPRTGINSRREYNLALSDLMRLILRDWPRGYAWHPELKARLRKLISGPLRDPETGFWGVRYRDGARLVPMQDLSVTYHVVRYLEGDVTDWPRLIATLLAIKDRPYPQGWLEDGYQNHHNYDVVALFRMGWAHATPAQKDEIRTEIHRMLDWCLSASVRPDGDVTITAADDSVEDGYYFAVSFLDEIGYFGASRRFWTNETFPEAPALASALRARIDAARAAGAGGSGGAYYANALAKLHRVGR